MFLEIYNLVKNSRKAENTVTGIILGNRTFPKMFENDGKFTSKFK
jgi:hypothetical protein